MRKLLILIILPLMSGLPLIVLWIDNGQLVKQNLLQKNQPVSTDTIVSSSEFINWTKEEIRKIFPFSLWHSKNVDYSKRNDRIDSQRKLMEYLPELHDFPVKNILVFVRGPAMIYFIKSENEELCPLKYKISAGCNFVRVNTKDMFSYASNISKFDAVISAVNSIEKNETDLWTHPPPHVYYTLESPLNPSVPKVNLSVNNKILASYWSNADISVPYGKWVKNKQQITSNIPPKNYVEGKTKLVAMIVSNCRDKNGRLKYAMELSKYIPVDIYGDCSPNKLNCGKNCFGMLRKDYKFYLAFENSNCRDYITEKLFRNALKHDVVPIVMGAHPADYKAVAPHRSYIHVDDFKSPSTLADYLAILNNTDELYNEYFTWKGTGNFIDTRNDLFCRICAMIIYSDFQPKPEWSTNSTWETENHCLANNVWHWTR